MALITIVSTVEQIPGVDGDVPTWRSWHFKNWFTQRGHKVEFLMSSWNHYTKEWRKPVGKGRQISFLYSLPYKKNVSLLRFINYMLQSAHLLLKLMVSRPDILIITVPALEHLISGVIYKTVFGRRKYFVIDYRDLWPEVIIATLKPNNSLLSALADLYYGLIRRAAMRKADAIVTISPLFARMLEEKYPDFSHKLSWAPHPKHPVDPCRLLEEAEEDQITLVYCGTISTRTNVAEFISCLLHKLPQTSIRIVVAGFGDSIEEVEILCARESRVEFRGHIPYSEVEELYLESDYGILPYPPLPDFDLSFPNKYLEYMSFGLKCLSNPLMGLSDVALPELLRPELVTESSELQVSSLSRRERELRIESFTQNLSANKMDDLLFDLEGAQSCVM